MILFAQTHFLDSIACCGWLPWK